MIADPGRLLEATPEALRWSGGEATLRDVHDAYANQASHALGAHLRAQRTKAPDAAERLEEALLAASGEGLERVLLAPETTARLFSSPVERVSSVTAFLEGALAAEASRPLAHAAAGQEMWTALGDVHVLPTGDVVRSPRVGEIVVDMDSPYATCSELLCGDSTSARGAPLDGGERPIVLERLEAAHALVSSAGLAWFVARFTKVLVLIKQEGRGFSSGSAGRYIGRSVLRNPERPDLDPLLVVESLVHEAIHALLYMQERRRRWVPPALHTPDPRVASPWTGRILAVRPFLQACFVWYGVLCFWGRVTATGLLPPARTAPRLARAAKGFLGPPLLESALREEAGSVDPSVRKAVREMQTDVRAAFA